MSETRQPPQVASLRTPLLAMARVFERLASQDTDPDYIRQSLRTAAECQRDALREPHPSYLAEDEKAAAELARLDWLWPQTDKGADQSRAEDPRKP